MTDEQKVYIRGVEGRGGEEVRQALINLGGKVLHDNDYYDYGAPDSLFFINHDGEIRYAAETSEIGKIIMDNYRELELGQWKYGDVLIRKDGSSFDVFYRYVADFSFSPLLEVTENVCNEYKRNVMVYAGYYRLATPSEVERFHKLLHKHGKEWDAEKKQLMDWRWKPKMNETYWFITGCNTIIRSLWANTSLDNKYFEIGNCFQSREEVEAAAERVRKALKGE